MATTLQINLAPTDLPHLIHTLPHQLRQLGDQVDEILLTIDLHRSSGRYATAWEERLPGFLKFVDDVCAIYPKVRSHEVDYSNEEMARVSAQFFGGKTIPAKDWMGAPFYAYFSGFYHARHNYIFHIDSDMLFGGGCQTWISDAVQLMQTRPEILACSPLPGPPTHDGSLRSQTLIPEPYTSLAFRAHGISTRVIFLDRERMISQLAPLSLIRPPLLRNLQSHLEGNASNVIAAEGVLSAAMQQKGLMRMDFLGQSPGMWSVHPPYRSALFYESLPLLIQRIESGEVSDGQRGDHDLNDSMIDWSSVRKSAWERKFGRFRLIFQHLAHSS
jgi:hypothetical protein